MKDRENRNEKKDIKQSQSEKKTETKQNEKYKIEYLHKMLDNQIEAVNTLFAKDNGFDEIEAKLKQLEVKLLNIREENPIIENQVIIQSDKNNQTRNQKNLQSKIKDDSVLTPFESLSIYKKSRKKKQEQERSKRKIVNQNEVEGKKLNFEPELDPNQNKKVQKSGRGSYKAQKNIQNQGIIPSNHLSPIKAKQRSISHKQSSAKQIKTISRQNSTKKPRITWSKSTNKLRAQPKSQKNLKPSKTYAYLQKQANKKNMKTKQQQDLNQNNKIKEMIRKIETKRLQKQLKDYKVKNENLQQQLAEMKGYKAQFEKLKQIFEKGERLKKSRRRL